MASERLFIGVDPGVGGGIAMINSVGRVVSASRMPVTERELLEELDLNWNQYAPIAVLERVSAWPKMGAVSAFTFGAGFGRLRMALTALEIPFDEVVPAKWQRALDCMGKGDKNVTKRRAQNLFPASRFAMTPAPKVTHAIADALLIAEYCRRRELPSQSAAGLPRLVRQPALGEHHGQSRDRKSVQLSRATR